MSKFGTLLFISLAIFAVARAEDYVELFEGSNVTDSFLSSGGDGSSLSGFFVIRWSSACNMQLTMPNGNRRNVKDVVNAALESSNYCDGLPGGPPMPTIPEPYTRPDPPPAAPYSSGFVLPPIVNAPSPPPGAYTADEWLNFCFPDDFNTISKASSKYTLWTCPQYLGVYCMTNDNSQLPSGRQGAYVGDASAFCKINQGTNNRLGCIATVQTSLIGYIGVVTSQDWHDNGKGCKSNADCFYPNTCFDYGNGNTGCRWPTFIPCVSS